MRKPIRVLCCLLCALMVLTSLPFTLATGEGEKAEGAHWVNSSVIGQFTEEMTFTERDDFAAAVNKDWFMSTEIREENTQENAFNAHEQVLVDSVAALLEGEPSKNPDARAAQQLYREAMDMDTRNALGLEPIVGYYQLIQSIDSIKKLGAYLEDIDSPVNPMFMVGIYSDTMDSTKRAVYLGSSSFLMENADEYAAPTAYGERLLTAKSELIQGLLVRLGMTQEEAEQVFQNGLAFDKELATATYGMSAQEDNDYFQKTYNPRTLKELTACVKALPIERLLADFTKAGVERFILTEPLWLEKLDAMYTEEKLPLWRDRLLCELTLQTVSYLDQDCLNRYDKFVSDVSGSEYHSALKTSAYDIVNRVLPMAVGRLYVESSVSPELKETIAALIRDVIAIYRQRLEKNDWLGEETRLKAIEKLDNVHAQVLYPDDWSAFMLDDLVMPEEGNLLASMEAVSKARYLKYMRLLNEPIDIKDWDESIAPQTINAFYDPLSNSFYILPGLLYGDFYTPDFTTEQLLASVGFVIAHEISHAFDGNGAQFDKEGNMVNWWTEADAAAFDKRCETVRDYFDGMEILPGQFLSGSRIVRECVADLGGLSCMIELSKRYENFDYDAFFHQYARIWKAKMPQEKQEYTLAVDTHAPGFIRINAFVQQFEEFYETYGVQPGDGMYLAPEARLSVW